MIHNNALDRVLSLESLFKKMYYLFESIREGEMVHPVVTCRMAKMPRDVPGPKPGAGGFFWVFHMEGSACSFGPRSAAFPGYWQGAGSEVKQTGTRPSLWDAGITGSNVTHVPGAVFTESPPDDP